MATNAIKPTNNQDFNTGYISNYTIDSDGIVKGTINTLDNENKNTTNSVSISLIQNVWGITSPNTNDQLLIMTNDSKYIGIGILFNHAVFILGSDNLLQYLSAIMYAQLYFILMYNFRSGINFIKLLILISTSGITTIPSTDTNYSTWNQISSNNQNIKNLYMYYAISADLAKNGSNSSYYKTINKNSGLTSIIADDYTYVANYYNTIYTQLTNTPSNFCVTSTAKQSSMLDPNKSDCRNNNSGSPIINTPNGPYGYGGAASILVNNKTTIIWIIVGILCCCCCMAAGVFIIMAMNSGKNKKHRGGIIKDDDYYYFN
jgi:hypothetical protein